MRFKPYISIYATIGFIGSFANIGKQAINWNIMIGWIFIEGY